MPTLYSSYLDCDWAEKVRPEMFGPLDTLQEALWSLLYSLSEHNPNKDCVATLEQLAVKAKVSPPRCLTALTQLRIMGYLNAPGLPVRTKNMPVTQDEMQKMFTFKPMIPSQVFLAVRREVLDSIDPDAHFHGVKYDGTNVLINFLKYK